MIPNISEKALSFFKENQYSYLNKEEWKYTNINKFKSFRYQKDKKTDENYRLEQSTLNEINISNCEFKSAKYSKGISIFNLKEALLNNTHNCSMFFNHIIPFEKNSNVALNTAYYNNGIFIYIEDHTIIENPIKLINTINNASPDRFLNKRILLLAGNNVSAKFINEEVYNEYSSINATCEVSIGNNSNIEFINISNKENSHQILNFGVNINKNSLFNFFPLDLSGALIKNNYHFNLNKENSQCNINGLNILNNNDHVDNFIQINHNCNHTISDTSFYNLLNNNSTSIFYAKAIINKNASSSEAYQNNKNMLLSEKSNIYSNPQLEIYNNDVKCSHASTTGEIDKEALHYLRTRGISYEESCSLIINGFINNILDKINIESVKSYLNNNILNNGNK